MAVELLVTTDPSSPELKHTEKMDVWAFGMVVYELLTSHVPYTDKPFDVHIILSIIADELPARPATKKKHAIFADALGSLKWFTIQYLLGIFIPASLRFNKLRFSHLLTPLQMISFIQ